MPAQDDILMLERRPWVRLLIGRRGSGKSYRMGQIMAGWQAARARGELGPIHAIDPVATEPPEEEHIAFWSDTWSVHVEDLDDGALPVGTELLVIDEADTSIGQGGGRRDSLAVDLVRRGRHRGVSLLLGTQRPALLLYDVWALADEVTICHLTSRRDLDRVAELDDGIAEHRAHIAAPGGPGPRLSWFADRPMVVHPLRQPD